MAKTGKPVSTCAAPIASARCGRRGSRPPAARSWRARSRSRRRPPRSARMRATCEGAVGTMAIVSAATSAKSAETDSAWSGSRASVTLRAGEFELRVAHGVDEDLALALVAQRDRGAGEQRERGEQQVGGSEPVSASRAPSTGVPKRSRSARAVASSEAPSTSVWELEPIPRMSASEVPSEPAPRDPCGSRRARRDPAGRPAAARTPRMSSREPDGVTGGEVRSREDGDPVGVERAWSRRRRERGRRACGPLRRSPLPVRRRSRRRESRATLGS